MFFISSLNFVPKRVSELENLNLLIKCGKALNDLVWIGFHCVGLHVTGRDGLLVIDSRLEELLLYYWYLGALVVVLLL